MLRKTLYVLVIVTVLQITVLLESVVTFVNAESTAEASTNDDSSYKKITRKITRKTIRRFHHDDSAREVSATSAAAGAKYGDIDHGEVAKGTSVAGDVVDIHGGKASSIVGGVKATEHAGARYGSIYNGEVAKSTSVAWGAGDIHGGKASGTVGKVAAIGHAAGANSHGNFYHEGIIGGASATPLILSNYPVMNLQLSKDASASVGKSSGHIGYGHSYTGGVAEGARAAFASAASSLGNIEHGGSYHGGVIGRASIEHGGNYGEISGGARSASASFASSLGNIEHGGFYHGGVIGRANVEHGGNYGGLARGTGFASLPSNLFQVNLLLPKDHAESGGFYHGGIAGRASAASAVSSVASKTRGGLFSGGVGLLSGILGGVTGVKNVADDLTFSLADVLLGR